VELHRLLGHEGRVLADHPELRRAQFGGAPAPVFSLAFDGDRVSIVR
jgi:levansucrase